MSSNFDHNYMKLGHNVKYNNVFLEFDNGLYRHMLSWVIALCWWKMAISMMYGVGIKLIYNIRYQNVFPEL